MHVMSVEICTGMGACCAGAALLPHNNHSSDLYAYPQCCSFACMHYAMRNVLMQMLRREVKLA